MAKSKLIKVNEKMAEGVVNGYKKIEEGVVGGYQKMENGVVDGFTKMTDKFVEEFLTKDGESVEQAKTRLAGEQAAREAAAKKMASSHAGDLEVHIKIDSGIGKAGENDQKAID